jgi:hypothetical protein
MPVKHSLSVALAHKAKVRLDIDQLNNLLRKTTVAKESRNGRRLCMYEWNNALSMRKLEG